MGCAGSCLPNSSLRARAAVLDQLVAQAGAGQEGGHTRRSVPISTSSCSKSSQFVAHKWPGHLSDQAPRLSDHCNLNGFWSPGGESNSCPAHYESGHGLVGTSRAWYQAIFGSSLTPGTTSYRVIRRRMWTDCGLRQVDRSTSMTRRSATQPTVRVPVETAPSTGRFDSR